MKKLIEQASNRRIFFFLAFAFLAFYSIQVPLVTSNSDVMFFSCRALSHLPIARYAYLDERSLLGRPPLPNYHIAHTVALWLVYHVLPSEISRTIWPSGLVSALCGALCAGLSFLIWFRLGFGKIVSFTSAVIAGLMPAVWNMSVLGLPYSMQLASTLLFLYCFLADRMVMATAAFVFAVCVSPIAGLSFSLVFLAPLTKRTIVKAAMCGFASLLVYFLVMHLLKIDVLAAFRAITPPGQGRSMVWKMYTFLLIFILNVNFMLPQLVRGSKILWSQQRAKTVGLFIAIAPWVVLAAKDSQFLDLPGNFLLMIFWALSLPVGLALAKVYHPVSRYFLIFFAVLCTYMVFCYFPDISLGLARTDAGNQLRTQVPQDVKIIGHWSCVPLMLTKYGWDLEKLASSYFESDGGNLNDSIMSKIGERSLIIVIRKEDKVHRRLKSWGIPGLQTRIFNQKDFKIKGAIRKVLENEALIAYTWDKDTAGLSK